MQTPAYKEPLRAPFERYRMMRATQPVFQHPEWGGWQVFRYADVSRVLSEHATFSSDARRMAQLEPRITAITNELLDHVTAAGEIDVVRDLAYPLPVTIIAELLGIPAELREDFKRWSDAFVAGDQGFSEEERKALFQEVQSMYGYFTQV